MQKTNHIVTEVVELIKLLHDSDLTAKCPNCYEEDLVSDWILFDGLKPIPPEVEETKKSMGGCTQTILGKIRRGQNKRSVHLNKEQLHQVQVVAEKNCSCNERI